MQKLYEVAQDCMKNEFNLRFQQLPTSLRLEYSYAVGGPPIAGRVTQLGMCEIGGPPTGWPYLQNQEHDFKFFPAIRTFVREYVDVSRIARPPTHSIDTHGIRPPTQVLGFRTFPGP